MGLLQSSASGLPAKDWLLKISGLTGSGTRLHGIAWEDHPRIKELPHEKTAPVAPIG
jgi:hypothetical protein